MPVGLDKLKHIVVLMMENRSFDHMLGGLKKKYPKINGLNGDALTLRAGGFPVVSMLYSQGGTEGHHSSILVNTSLLGGSARPSLF
jgi:phospholipase C